ncbi:hypothetical protein Q5P01_024652 [Channa striata]|uniref:Saposin B-type domain-containing protein n=1 Tax=Channa striata TaxID=64152 RepID=A0AA88IS00_CHASR|nr:hypothetical protein Q5P01_024652 [Channa striata]
MALVKYALLLSIALQGCGLTSALNMEELLSVPDARTLKKVMNGIEGLCAHLPGPVSEACKDKVEKMFPLAITFITGFVVQPTNQCSFCIFITKSLEDLLPKERTESAVTKLLEEICLILPPTYRDQCENVIEKYGKTVLDAILSYATPQPICSIIQMCKRCDAPIGILLLKWTTVYVPLGTTKLQIWRVVSVLGMELDPDSLRVVAERRMLGKLLPPTLAKQRSTFNLGLFTVFHRRPQESLVFTFKTLLQYFVKEALQAAVKNENENEFNFEKHL